MVCGTGHGPESEVTLISLFLGVKTLEVLGEIVSLLWMVSFMGRTFLFASQYPLPVYGSLSLFSLSVSGVQCLLVSHMRKTHS